MSETRKMQVAANRTMEAMRVLAELRASLDEGLGGRVAVPGVYALLDELAEELMRLEDVAGSITPAALFGE